MVPPGQPLAGVGDGLGTGGAGLGGAVGAVVGAAVGAGAHLFGSGPCTTFPSILRLETLKLEAPKLPSPPQLPGTQPVHWDE